MYIRRLQKASHTRKFTITTTGASGWEVRDEQDSRVIRWVRYRDWHRVERARAAFALEAALLEESGWDEAWVRLKADATASESCNKPIAEADDGLDLLAGGAQLSAQAPDVHVHRAGLDGLVVAPHAFEQPIARQHAVLVGDEIPQQLELTPREPHRLAVDVHGDGVEVRDDMFAAVHRRDALAAVRTAAQHGTHARGELAQAERLGDVGVGADVEARNVIALRRSRRQHDDGDLRGLGTAAHDAAHFHAAQHRQIQIENHQIGHILCHALERGVAAARDVHRHGAFAFERVLDESRNVLLVLDDEN